MVREFRKAPRAELRALLLGAALLHWASLPPFEDLARWHAALAAVALPVWLLMTIIAVAIPRLAPRVLPRLAAATDDDRAKNAEI